MAQVSLYLDEKTFEKVETAAHLSDISISKYVAEIIRDHFVYKWPSGYGELFGSVSDKTFFPHGSEKITEDTVREPL